MDICTPTFLHESQVREALSYPCSVICEKPLTFKAAIARELFDLARINGVHLYVAHVVRFMKEAILVRRLIEEETYGKVLDAQFKRLSAVPEWAAGGWLFDPLKSGLLPYDLHIHDLDLIISLFGTPDAFESYMSHAAYDFGEHLVMNYTIGNKRIIAEAGWLNALIPFTVEWFIYFERGYLVYRNDVLIVYPSEGEEVHYPLADDVLISTGINVPATGMYYRELSHFVSCLTEQRDSEIIGADQVIAALAVLEKITL